MTKRTTIYLNSQIHQAIKIKSAQTSISVSELINHALQLSLKEDAIDLEAIDRRSKEPVRGLDAVIAGLKKDGLI
jgi:hypothetical protein